MHQAESNRKQTFATTYVPGTNYKNIDDATDTRTYMHVLAWVYLYIRLSGYVAPRSAPKSTAMSPYVPLRASLCYRDALKFKSGSSTRLLDGQKRSSE